MGEARIQYFLVQLGLFIHLGDFWSDDLVDSAAYQWCCGRRIVGLQHAKKNLTSFANASTLSLRSLSVSVIMVAAVMMDGVILSTLAHIARRSCCTGGCSLAIERTCKRTWRPRTFGELASLRRRREIMADDPNLCGYSGQLAFPKSLSATNQNQAKIGKKRYPGTTGI